VRGLRGNVKVSAIGYRRLRAKKKGRPSLGEVGPKRHEGVDYGLPEVCGMAMFPPFVVIAFVLDGEGSVK